MVAKTLLFSTLIALAAAAPHRGGHGKWNKHGGDKWGSKDINAKDKSCEEDKDDGAIKPEHEQPQWDQNQVDQANPDSAVNVGNGNDDWKNQGQQHKPQQDNNQEQQPQEEPKAEENKPEEPKQEGQQEAPKQEGEQQQQGGDNKPSGNVPQVSGGNEGIATFYNVMNPAENHGLEPGTVSCPGRKYSNREIFVAIASETFSSESHCGKMVRVTDTTTGNSAEAVVVDECQGCGNKIDLSATLWSQLHGQETLYDDVTTRSDNDGIFAVKWEFV